MALIRTKNNVPQPYVSESRDFQIFTRVLDFSQNSVKFDIDSMINILDTDLISGNYLDRLKSKLGFFTNSTYDDRTMRIVLSAFPYIMRYKGSEEGIRRCVNTYLNVMGVDGGSRIDIYNNIATYKYTVRVGISGVPHSTQILKDMLSYVLPSGYVLEIYSYKDSGIEGIRSKFGSTVHRLVPTTQQEFTVVRAGDVDGGSIVQNATYNTVQLSAVYDKEESIDE